MISCHMIMSYMYLYISMLSSQMTGKTPGNHDTVSRNKACCILAARQELKLKGKERLLRKLDLRSHNSTSNCCHPGFFTHTCRSHVH